MSDGLTGGYLQKLLEDADALAAQGKYVEAIGLLSPHLTDEGLVALREVEGDWEDIYKERVNRYRVTGREVGQQVLADLNQFVQEIAEKGIEFEPSDMLKLAYNQDDFVTRWVKAAETAFKLKEDEFNIKRAQYVAAIERASESETYVEILETFDREHQRLKKNWMEAAIIYQVERTLKALEELEEKPDAAASAFLDSYRDLSDKVKNHIANHGGSPTLTGLAQRLDGLRDLKGRQANIYSSARQQDEYIQAIKDLKRLPDGAIVERYDNAGNYLGKTDKATALEELMVEAVTWANDKKAVEYLSAARSALADEKPREALFQLNVNLLKIKNFLIEEKEELNEENRNDAKELSQRADAQLKKLTEAEAARDKSREHLVRGKFTEAWTQYTVALKAFPKCDGLDNLKNDILDQALDGIGQLEDQARKAYENSRPRTSAIKQVDTLYKEAKNHYGRVQDDAITDRLKEFDDFRAETTKHDERVREARKALKEAEDQLKRGTIDGANDKLTSLRRAYHSTVLEDLNPELDTLSARVDGALNLGKLKQELTDLLRVNSLDAIRSKLDAARALNQKELADAILKLEWHQHFIEAKGYLAVRRVDDALKVFNEIAGQADHPDRTEAKALADKIAADRAEDGSIKTTLEALRQKMGSAPAEVYRSASKLTPIDDAVISLKSSVMSEAKSAWLQRIESDLDHQDQSNRGDTSVTAPKMNVGLVKTHLEDLAGDLDRKDRHDVWWGVLGARYKAAIARAEEKGEGWENAVKAWEEAIELASPTDVPVLNRALAEAKTKQAVWRTEHAQGKFEGNDYDFPSHISVLIGDLKTQLEANSGEPVLKLCLARASIWAAFHVEKLDKGRANLTEDSANLRLNLFIAAQNYANGVKTHFKGKPEASTVDLVLEQAKIGIEISEPMGMIYKHLTARDSVKHVAEAVLAWEGKVKKHASVFPQLTTWWLKLESDAKSSLQTAYGSDGEIRQDRLKELGMLVVLANDIKAQPPSAYTRLLVNGISQLQRDCQAEKDRILAHFRTGEGGYKSTQPLEIIKAQITEMQAAIAKYNAVAQLVDHFSGDSKFTNVRHSFESLSQDLRSSVDQLLELEKAVSNIQSDFNPDMTDVKPLLDRLEPLETVWQSDNKIHRALRILRQTIEGRGIDVTRAGETVGRLQLLLAVENYETLEAELTKEKGALSKVNKAQTFIDPADSKHTIASVDELLILAKRRAEEHRKLRKFLGAIGASGLWKPILIKGDNAEKTVTQAEPPTEFRGRRPIDWPSEKVRITALLSAGEFEAVRGEVEYALDGYQNDAAYRNLTETLTYAQDPESGMGLTSSGDPSIEARYAHAVGKVESKLTKEVLGKVQAAHIPVLQGYITDAKNLRTQADANQKTLDEQWSIWVNAHRDIAKVFESAGGWDGARLGDKDKKNIQGHWQRADGALTAVKALVSKKSDVITEMEKFWLYKYAQEKAGIQRDQLSR